MILLKLNFTTHPNGSHTYNEDSLRTASIEVVVVVEVKFEIKVDV